MATSGTEKKRAQKRVARTQRLMEVGGQLRDFRDRIDELIKTISSGEEFHSDVANEIISIGTNIQRLSKLVRPLSIEAQEKKMKRNLHRRWVTQVGKNRAALPVEEFTEWMSTYSTPRGYRSNTWGGPNDAFFEDYMKPSETITEKA